MHNLAMRTAMMGGSGDVDYGIDELWSTRDQYIDTGISAASPIQASARVLFVKQNGWENYQCVVGASGRLYPIYLYTGKWRIGYGASDITGASETTPGVWHDIEASCENGAQTAYVDGTQQVSAAVAGDVASERNFYIFALNDGTAKDYVLGRLKRVKLMRNGRRILDGVAAMSPNGEPCLYDRVTQTHLLSATVNGFIGIRYIDRETKTGRYEAFAPSIRYIPEGGRCFAALADKTNLVSVGDLSACTSIGTSAFSGCSALASVGDLSACTSIGTYAFIYCAALASVGSLAACKTIGEHAFFGCRKLTAVNLSSACTNLVDGAFRTCSALASVGDLSGVTSIGSYTFESCAALTSVNLSSACTSIGYSAFSGCSALTAVGDLSACTSIGTTAFSGCTALTSVGDLSACTSIGERAFANCTALTSVGDLSACTSIGSYAFSGCSALASLTFASKTHTEVEAITGFAYFPQRATCVFHCADGDYYSNGTNLLPVT